MPRRTSVRYIRTLRFQYLQVNRRDFAPGNAHSKVVPLSSPPVRLATQTKTPARKSACLFQTIENQTPITSFLNFNRHAWSSGSV